MSEQPLKTWRVHLSGYVEVEAATEQAAVMACWAEMSRGGDSFGTDLETDRVELVSDPSLCQWCGNALGIIEVATEQDYHPSCERLVDRLLVAEIDASERPLAQVERIYLWEVEDGMASLTVSPDRAAPVKLQIGGEMPVVVESIDRVAAAFALRFGRHQPTFACWRAE